MSDPATTGIDPNTLGPFHSPTGGISMMRVGFFVCLAEAVLLGNVQAFLIIAHITGDLSGIIYAFLGAGMGGKVGQSFAER